MNDKDQFVDLISKINKWTPRIKDKTMTLSDYYFKMADYFNQIEPHKGAHMGNWFDFQKDAQELIQLAKKELKNELQ